MTVVRLTPKTRAVSGGAHPTIEGHVHHLFFHGGEAALVPVQYLVSTSSSLPTTREGIHRPGRGHHDDAKALLKTSVHVHCWTGGRSAGDTKFLADGQNAEQCSFDIWGGTHSHAAPWTPRDHQARPRLPERL